MKDLQLSGRSSAEFSSRILKLATSPLTILHTDLSSFLQANLSKPKNLPGTVQTFFRLRGFSAPKTPWFPGQKHHRLRKKNTSSTRCTSFSYPNFFWGGWIIYRWRFSKRSKKDIIHPAAGKRMPAPSTASPLLEAKKRRVDPLSTKN